MHLYVYLRTHAQGTYIHISRERARDRLRLHGTDQMSRSVFIDLYLSIFEYTFVYTHRHVCVCVFGVSTPETVLYK